VATTSRATPCNSASSQTTVYEDKDTTTVTIQKYIDNFNCDYCHRNKLDGKGYRLLPECEVRSIPFEECAVDVLGPWIVQARGNPCEFSALTAIDTVTNLVDIIRVDDKNLETLKLYLINYPYLLIMGRQCFVFLFR